MGSLLGLHLVLLFVLLFVSLFVSRFLLLSRTHHGVMGVALREDLRENPLPRVRGHHGVMGQRDAVAGELQRHQRLDGRPAPPAAP
ncbi:hypothetical protein, partial [Streptomyces polyrhachis]|uniref:hypothetical protein n=1 Tax=Streptomyces polyrhachis TaxID=1282885 RepID=UPI0036DE6843